MMLGIFGYFAICRKRIELPNSTYRMIHFGVAVSVVKTGEAPVSQLVIFSAYTLGNNSWAHKVHHMSPLGGPSWHSSQ